MKRFLALALCALLTLNFVTYTAALPVTAPPATLAAYDAAYFAEIDAKGVALQNRLADCLAAGIPVDYEMVNVSAYDVYRMMMRNFQGWNNLDPSHGWWVEAFNLEEAQYYHRCLEDIYNEAMESMDALLAGEKTSAWVPRYVTSETEIRGQSIWATTKAGDRAKPDTLVEEVRPVIFVGFGGYDQGYNESRRVHGFNAFGYDSHMAWANPPYIQLDDSAEAGYKVNYYTVPDGTAAKAEADNFYVATMVSPHHLYGELINRYGIYMDNGPHAFMNFNIADERAQKVITDFMEARLPQLKDSKSFKSLSLTNEPVFHSWKSPAHLAPWREFARERYNNDIAALNKNWCTRYQSFDEIPFPAMKASAMMVDFVDYNDKVMDDFNLVMVDKAREILGGIPIDTKLMDYYSTGKWKNSYDERVFLRGSDHEKFAGYTQLNGCDAWRNLDRSFNAPLDQAFDPVKYNSKSMWYDMLRSANNAPVYNSEDHLTIDDDERLIPEFVPFLISDIWQGAVHGRGVSTAWIWQYGKRGSMYHHSLGWRPDLVVAMAHTALDLNRLSYEVTALQNTPADVAILYSKSSHIFDYRNVTETMYDAYQCASLSGQRVDFVTENDIAEKLCNYKLLILPKASRISDANLAAIKAFQKNGGSVVILGLDSLWFDEYGHMRSPLDILPIYVKAAKMMPSLNIFGISLAFIKCTQQRAVQKVLAKKGLYHAALTDTKTGRPVAETEWFATEYDGKTIINMCSFTWGVDRTVKVSIGGRDCGAMTDLISGETFNGTVTLKPFLPRLIQVG